MQINSVIICLFWFEWGTTQPHFLTAETPWLYAFAGLNGVLSSLTSSRPGHPHPWDTSWGWEFHGRMSACQSICVFACPLPMQKVTLHVCTYCHKNCLGSLLLSFERNFEIHKYSDFCCANICRMILTFTNSQHFCSIPDCVLPTVCVVCTHVPYTDCALQLSRDHSRPWLVYTGW